MLFFFRNTTLPAPSTIYYTWLYTVLYTLLCTVLETKLFTNIKVPGGTSLSSKEFVFFFFVSFAQKNGEKNYSLNAPKVGKNRQRLGKL